MKKNTSSKTVFPFLYCFYEGVSNDLAFWPLFNVLYLSFYRGYSDVSISLIFSVSFGVSLVLHFASLYLIKKIRTGRLMIIGAVMFLCASLFITFGKSLAAVIIGQCMYELAFVYQEMSAAFLEGIVYEDGSKPNFVHCVDSANTLYCLCSLISCLFLNRLCAVSYALPMYICIAFCLVSLILVISLNRYESVPVKKNVQQLSGRFHVPKWDSTSVRCLIMSALSAVIIVLGRRNLEIFIRSDLSLLYSEATVVRIFSEILIIDRIIKLFGNLSGLIGAHSKKRNSNGMTGMVCIVICIPVLGVLSCSLSGGVTAILPAVIAYFAGVFVRDPFAARLSGMMLHSLDTGRRKNLVFINSVMKDGAKALFSFMVTAILACGTMRGVMLLFCAVAVAFALCYFLRTGALTRKKNNTVFTQWTESSCAGVDGLLVAAAVLMCYYNITASRRFTPAILSENIQTAEKIGKKYKNFRFLQYSEYSSEELEIAFSRGLACAVKLSLYENAPPQWYPVLLSDNDGYVIYSIEEQWVMFDKNVPVEQICTFSVAGQADTVNTTDA